MSYSRISSHDRDGYTSVATLGNCFSQVAYGVGIAVQALIAYFVKDWKAFSLLITLLNLPFIVYYW